MRIVYPLLWSRLDRRACAEQSVNTAAALARRGHEVTLLMPRTPGDPALTAEDLRDWFDVEGDVRVVQRGVRWSGAALVPSTLWLRRLLRDPEVRRADLLYSRIPHFFVGGFACPVPFAIDHYRPWGDDWRALRPFIRGTARLARCLGYVLHSGYAAESYRRIGVPAEKILVAHNGAAPARAAAAPGRAEARRALGLPEARPIAVYAGRINARKGLDRLLELADLRPEVLFVLVGSEGEGPVEAAARDRANVRVVPWQPPPALPAYLQAADLLVVPPSLAPLERHGDCVLPLKLFAYFAAGRPILAPLAPDTAGFLVDGENALLVPPDSPAAAAAGLDRLLAEPALAARLAAAGLAMAREHSWDRRAERLLAFLAERLAAMPRPVRGFPPAAVPGQRSA